MKSTIKNIIFGDKFLSTGEDNTKQYKIPIYQRHYDWDNENAVNLLNDIVDAIEIKKPHFTGSFLLANQNRPIVIDGQQRMITTLISLKAFYLVCEEKNIKDQIGKIIFVDSNHKTSENLRLSVSLQDRQLFNSIMCVKKFNLIINHKDAKMYYNFKYAYDFFTELKNTYSDYEIYNYGFCNLQICELLIEEEVDDDSQKIFRDLNSKGQALKNSDLIRNYLLMSEEELYDQYWIPIEDMFKVNGEFNSDLFEEFIYNYVLMKSPTKINENKIFNAYVNLCENKKGEFIVDGIFSREKAVEDLLEYSNIYRLFLNISIDEENIINKYSNTIKLLSELRDMKQTTPYPFLMRVVMDENKGIINVDTLNDVINLIIVYYVRAIVCKISTGSRRGYLLTMYKNIFGEVLENKTQKNYYNAIYKYIYENGSYSKMPSEEKFLKELKTFDLYNNRPVCRQLLKAIVNNRYPNEFGEKIEVDNPTIEHLLPETPDAVWENELGGKDKLNEAMEYVHTIGNLSLANHNKNSELSNKSRKQKAEILEKYGEGLNVLNRSFIDLKENFSLDFIFNRSDFLISILKNRYTVRKGNTKDIYFENYDIFNGETEWDDRFKGRSIAYIEIEGNSYMVDNFYDLNAMMQSYFYKNYHDEYLKLLDNPPIIGSHPIIIKEKKKYYYKVPGTENIYFKAEEGGTSFFAISRVAKALNIPLDKIKLFVKIDKIPEHFYDFKIIDNISDYNQTQIFVIERNNKTVYAEAIYSEGKIIVLKGTQLSKKDELYMNPICKKTRKELLDLGILDNNFIFVKDCMFNSPNSSSALVLGYLSNGKVEWHTKENYNVKLKDWIENN